MGVFCRSTMTFSTLYVYQGIKNLKKQIPNQESSIKVLNYFECLFELEFENVLQIQKHE